VEGNNITLSYCFAVKTIILDLKANLNGMKGFEAVVKTIFNYQFRAVLNFRIYSFLYKTRFGKILGFLMYQRAKRVYNADISPSADIGAGFQISHLGAIVIGGHAKIGQYANINSCVTIGEARPCQGMPQIGDNVTIGTGAKILGPIIIAANCTVGANAVVLKSFLRSGTLVGVPATIKNVV
jgi:serine O-acetyltransferase